VWQAEAELASGPVLERIEYADPEGLSPAEIFEDPTMVEVVVDACEEPASRRELQRWPYLACTARFVLGAPGSSEQIRVTWPQYSRRWEAGHPNFQDPVIGQTYWLTFDARFRNESVVYFARKTGARSDHGGAK
jgi:hypothetical protein